MSLIVLTGATGFIGRHFVHHLAQCGLAKTRVRALSRGTSSEIESDWINWTTGDLDDPSVWDRLLEPGCTVVNLAYAQVSATEKAISAMEALAKACADHKVRRLVHCSTISVCGRTSGGVVNEATECNPLNAYGRHKLIIEKTLLRSAANRIELVIVRPTTVFGEGGEALKVQCGNLLQGDLIRNYLRFSLFGHRKIHLVPVETVVEALRFFCDIDKPLNGEIFNVSCDDDPLNNFADVERVLARELAVPGYPLPPFPVPRSVLKGILRWRGRNEVDVDCEYSSEKLRNWGFAPSIGLLPALQAYAASHVALRKVVGEAA